MHDHRKAGVGVALIALLLSGCATGSTPAASLPAPTTAAPATSAPADPLEPTSSALAFDLPPLAGYEPVGRRVTDNGAVIRQWRRKLQDSGLHCVVIAGEQPDFRGAFPASALASFRANRGPGGAIQVNQATAPIRGTVAGVRQQSSYLFSLGTAGTASGMLLARQYLTRERTLISLNVTGPADDAERCRLAAIVDSLRVSSASDQSPSGQFPAQTSQAPPTIGERTP